MSVVIGTLCINEMEWLPKLYEQHKNWPGLKRWVFVEAADRQYAKTNPELVSNSGLSLDGTDVFLTTLAIHDPRVVYIPYGFSDHPDVAQGKCPARQMYMDEAEEVKPDYILALDADEFFMREDQKQADKIMNETKQDGVLLGYHNIWRPKSIRNEPLFAREVVGNFWKIKVCKLWRWHPGLCYNGNHNAPYHDGIYSNKRLEVRQLNAKGAPKFIHMGFASDHVYRAAKNHYYADRGEAQETPKYVASRGAFETWNPGDKLPNGDTVILYTGPIPEVFQSDG